MLPEKLSKWIPVLFVLLWATGFIGAKFALPFAEPFTLLWVRMLITLGIILVLTSHYHPKWPCWQGAAHSMVVGALVHATYLGGVFAAIHAGMSASLSSLLVGMQPILTALVVWVWMGDRIKPRQALGLALGLAGIGMVLLLGKPTSAPLSVTAASFSFAMMALVGITIGTLYQKRFCGKIDLLPGTFYQYLATSLIMGLLSYTFETGDIDWTPTFIAALIWLIFGLSISAILLLMLMIKQGQATKVASYFYLTPPVTAALAWLLFDETLTPWGMAGIALAAYGVYLVVAHPFRISGRSRCGP